MRPAFYDKWVEAVVGLREKNKQLAVTLGYFVKKLAILKRAEAIRKGDVTMREEASEFIDLYQSSWGETVMTSTIRMQQLEKVCKAVALPLTEDLQMLTKYIDNEIDRETNCATPDFIILQKLILSVLLMFNKRRPQEVAAITLADYRMAQAVRDNGSDIDAHLAIEERAISGR